MIDVKFYRFNKRRNSTAIPSNSDLAITKSCLLRDYTSVINPVIVVEAKLSLEVPENFDSYNYVEIPEFNRFYFVDNIGYNNNTWIFSLTVDVLGSFRDDIRASSQFVSRTSTASQIDSSYIDTTYDTKSGSFVVNKYNGDTTYVSSRIGADDNLSQSTPNVFGIGPTPSNLGGYYVLGVVGQDGDGLKYYVCTRLGFISLLQKILTISVSMSTGSGNLSGNLARSIFDPIQYIKYCRWFPNCPLWTASTVSSKVTSIYIGNQSITLDSNYDVYTFSPVATCTSLFRLDIPKSPYNTNTNHRDYLNLKPYAELNLYMPVFGNIPLDTVKVFDYSKLCIRWVVDYCTGSCLLELIPYTSSNTDELFSSTNIIYTSNVNYGVDIPLFNLSLDVMAATTLTTGAWLENKLSSFINNNVISNQKTASNKVNSFLESLPWYESAKKARDFVFDKLGIETSSSNNVSLSNISTAVHESFGDTIDLLASSLGQVHSTGNPSSYVAYRSSTVPMIIGYFFNQADENIAKFGAPCNKTISPLSTLSGFTVCRNSNIDFTVHTTDNKTNITMSEREAIIVFMNSGFYLE